MAPFQHDAMGPPHRVQQSPRAAAASFTSTMVSALRWADVTVRRSKTNQEGEVNDVRFVKDGVARAIRALRTATSPEPGESRRAVVGARWWDCDSRSRRRTPASRAASPRTASPRTRGASDWRRS